ncbi:MAG TPA: hypothetical protein ENJ79_07850 [Gammaproteobacteria bacterium]|nr:hypothetical protein [Gammaproteobacteria bacterium]
MKKVLIEKLLQVLLGLLDEDTLKRAADAVLDAAEDAVKGSKSGMDDAIVLPLLGAIRTAFDIPDND